MAGSSSSCLRRTIQLAVFRKKFANFGGMFRSKLLGGPLLSKFKHSLLSPSASLPKRTPGRNDMGNSNGLRSPTLQSKFGSAP